MSSKTNANSGPGALTRRTLLRAGVASGALAAAGPLVPRPTSAAETSTPAAPFELEEATIAQLQAGLRSGKYTAVALLEKYLARVEELNLKGPQLRALIEVNPDAHAIAKALDAELKEKGPRGPLHGIPILLKDNIGTADRMTTTAGSLALEGSITPRDAFIAGRLRAAGAVLLGKANLSEWANFRSRRSSSGWSSRGGQCRNPYALDRDPSGSSSGSAVAASANLCAAAVGSETDGSIVSPASRCGIVGIKPTLGLLSRSGIIPIAHSQDTAGPMARTVADAAALLYAMTGVDERDEASRASRGPAAEDYTKFLDPNGLKGARIGVFRPRSLEENPLTNGVLANALAVLRDGGALIVDPVKIESAGKFSEAEHEVLLYEFKSDLNRYLADLGPGAPVKTLKEAIAFNEKHRDRVMPYFGQDIFLAAEGKGPLTDEAYKKALETCRQYARKEGLDATFDQHKLDAIVAPSGGPAWLIDWINGDSGTGGSSSLSAVSGYPNITVPAGWAFGLPLGISFLGAAWSEPVLIRLAYAFEQATKARRAPRFLPSAPIAPPGA
ncbi:MAG TPA: amidase [Thermoanaerobaculia bacterium]|nr:amidase [Thermoanaerobaculia bacterium]